MNQSVRQAAARRAVHWLAGPVLGIVAAVVYAQSAPAFPDAQTTDPAKTAIMVGSPPPADKVVQFSDGSGYRFPLTRWSFSHYRELVPTARVWRGTGTPSPLPRAERTDLDAIAFSTLDGRPMTWEQSLAANYTDGIVVLHKGTIIYERYFGALKPHLPHIAMSVTKSFTGTLGAMLVADGTLDEKALVTKYIPELKGTAYGDATIRQVLDMTIGVRYSENYADPKAEIWDHVRAGGVLPRPPGYAGPKHFYEFLVTLQKEGEHGQAFAYKTVNTDVMAWVIRRATGKSLSELLSERIWQKIGAEEDGYITIDSHGTEFAGGGLNTTLRDLARFGETMRRDGFYNGQQIVPKSVVADIRKGASKEAFTRAGYRALPGWTYRDMWWVSHNEHGAYSARGVHGQLIYIDPKAELVIARYASHPLASNVNLDPTSLPAYHALAKHLLKQ